MSYRLAACPLCGGQSFRPLLRARDYHYGNPGEFSQAECNGCSLAFLDPMYDEAELARFYPSDYYAFTDRFLGPRRTLTWKQRVWRLLGIREHRTKDPRFARPGRMLDIGCGSGWFLSEMRDRGWQVKGVEPSVAAAEFGRKEKGLDIFPGSLLDAGFASGSFEYIRLNHSFEHMAHPKEILDEIFRILADDGKLMIGVPNRDGMNARLFGPYWHHLALPVHTFSYSAKTLPQLLKKHGFQVERVLFNTESTALLESLQIYLSRNQPASNTRRSFARGRVATLICGWIAHLQNFFHVADVIEVTAAKQR
jgi:SAM-dependent methyltransferase